MEGKGDKNCNKGDRDDSHQMADARERWAKKNTKNDKKEKDNRRTKIRNKEDKQVMEKDGAAIGASDSMRTQPAVQHGAASGAPVCSDRRASSVHMHHMWTSYVGAQDSEFQVAQQRPRMLKMIKTCAHSHALAGHDVGTLFLDHLRFWRLDSLRHNDMWQPAPHKPHTREPHQRVGIENMEIFNKFLLLVRSACDSVSDSDSEVQPGVAGHLAEKQQRQPTLRWYAREDDSLTRSKFNAKIEAAFEEHEGEARVWQADTEEWIPVDPAGCEALSILESQGMLTYPPTTIGKTHDERTDEFYKSECSDANSFRFRHRTLMEFGHYEQPAAHGHCQDAPPEQPNLDDAVSTLLVRGAGGQSTKFWIRKVKVITLPELFHNYMGDVSWKQLYHAWLEGACVIRAIPKQWYRGAASGAAESGVYTSSCIPSGIQTHSESDWKTQTRWQSETHSESERQTHAWQTSAGSQRRIAQRHWDNWR